MMLTYRSDLKERARLLRNNATDSEALLWSRLRRKQLLGIQFYRQKPIGRYIVDFFAPRVRLVVEVDGSQHLEGKHSMRDATRDAFLAAVGLTVLRFNSREVLKETAGVLEVIHRVTAGLVSGEIPPSPPLQRGREVA
jgi:very-short-patch-repair endonuclease